MRKQTLWLSLSCLMVVAVLMASCAAPGTEDETVAPSERAGEEPQYGGTLNVIGLNIQPQSWDLADIIWFTSIYVSFYQENLLIGDLSRGPGGTGEWAFNNLDFVPDEVVTGLLAESWETPDPQTIIFHIRQGVMFPDKPGVMASREMTADDVVFSWNRLLTSPSIDLAPISYKGRIESVTALDKYTVVFKLEKYQGDWMIAIGFSILGKIYPPELVDAGANDWKNAVGTGPFMLEEYIEGSSVVYERNPIYWGKTTLGGKEYQLPFVDSLVLLLVGDESTRLATLRTGKADIVESVSWKYKESLEESNPDLLRFQLASTGTLVGMRPDTKPFDDIRVRRALAIAIDNQAVLDTIYGGHGWILGFPFEPSWQNLYTPLEELPESTRELFSYDPEKAKQLLVEAGYPNGFNTSITITSSAAEICSMLAAYWEDIGVECELKVYEYGTWNSILRGHTQEQMLYYGKTIGNPFQTFSCVGGDPPGSYNGANYTDPYFTEVYDEALAATDIDERNSLLKELSLFLLDQSPYIVLPVGSSFRYAWPWVKNYYGESQAGSVTPGPCYAKFWLDQDLKKSMGY